VDLVVVAVVATATEEVAAAALIVTGATEGNTNSANLSNEKD
jgi:hypothetical protein